MSEEMKSEASLKKKILLIDDEEDFCFFVKLNLEQSGKYEVLTATSGSSGIILASKEHPDLILLDIIMPEMSGGQVAELLLENPKTKNIPVLFITAIASRREVQSQEGIIGGRNFIAKPVTPDELMARLESFFKYHSQQS
ncbi:MAG: response regulator [Deltaproteobacteria bacterium]|nr:response regulator [Deltaproteobacteria bacterium]